MHAGIIDLPPLLTENPRLKGEILATKCRQRISKIKTASDLPCPEKYYNLLGKLMSNRFVIKKIIISCISALLEVHGSSRIVKILDI
jgi:hypothetical protein